MKATDNQDATRALQGFHPTLRDWFLGNFATPTPVQQLAWPIIATGQHALLLAPTGSGKTLAAFLVAIDRILFAPDPPPQPGVRVLYISPLKALGVDVERNLRSPLAGVTAAAERLNTPYRAPTVAVRSGDTPPKVRAQIQRQPPDILITTPESLYLILTSRARRILESVETVIIDEIHSLVGNKRGAHLFVSLERLGALRQAAATGRRPMQRIGLSATQRPLEEIALLLGGADSPADPALPPRPRPVQIVQAGRSRQLDLRIEVPVEDMARLARPEFQSGDAANGPTFPSIWPSIHPRLVELIRQHRTTMIFVNSRRLAERLASAINDLAEEELALAHHGSISKDTRLQIEDRLKRGVLPAIVATSSLELGIDMGAIDLVIQIEAPPSVASGIQRIGRAGHGVAARPSGVIIPKYRGDLLACSAAAERILQGEVEETYFPRNPLDVLAQQIVAMVASGPMPVDEVYRIIRRAAPFHDLPRSAFEGVLDLLAGRYPSQEFSELRPRLNWDRLQGVVAPRKGTQRLAVLNAGTIPDRGLYGVFLEDGQGGSSRVGELDEEMVFETHAGDVFLLGASSWRVLDITQDRVIVAPAPGEPGKMPFWRGDGPGRPVEFGRAIGRLTRHLLRLKRDKAEAELITRHALDARAARNLLDYLHEQAEATEDAPHDRLILVECFRDELGDWRVCILSPFGGRVHAPWAMAVAARLRRHAYDDVDMVWSDDGIVFRLPDSDRPPPLELLVPQSSEVEQELVQELGSTALFASRFRENAARALLLPRRQPGRRTPLWLQRRRASHLLSVASRYSSFPILLETYRECLRDVFDMRGLKGLLEDVERRSVQVRLVETATPSPFAASLLFNYVGQFIYNGDLPLTERKAAALSLDHAQLRELLGDAELRQLLDAEVIEQLALELQHLDGRRPLRDADDLHDLLLRLGDLTDDELEQRAAAGASNHPPAEGANLAVWLETLTRQRRILRVRIAGQERWIAAEDAARYRDALGTALPAGLPDAFLESVERPLEDLLLRYAQTHTPFTTEQLARRYPLGIGPLREALQRLCERGRLLHGEFLPGGRGREWCEVEVLRLIKRRSLARLRKQVEPVDQWALARFLPHWQGVTRPRKGLDALLDVIQQLQGAPLPASDLEQMILPARIKDFRPTDLDQLCAAGEVVWRGCEAIGTSDGRVALYLADQLPLITSPSLPHLPDDPLAEKIHALLAARGALFFDAVVQSVGGFRNDVLDALWQLVWAGEVTNDTLAPLRSLRTGAQSSRPRARRTPRRAGFRSRRAAQLPGSEGRWSLLFPQPAGVAGATERQVALAAQLLERYGVVTREMVAAEGVQGGFAAVYPVLKGMEEAGRARRGYFVAGLGAAQFALAGAEDRLRQMQQEEPDDQTGTWVLAATDPANPYGAALPWPPRTADQAARPARAAGSMVILHSGRLVGYIGRTGRSLMSFLPEAQPDTAEALEALCRGLSQVAARQGAVLLAEIDGLPAGQSPLADALRKAGFAATSRGLLGRHHMESLPAGRR